jgi:hypothetical protein
LFDYFVGEALDTLLIIATRAGASLFGEDSD